jgi:hypothetical protein
MKRIMRAGLLIAAVLLIEVALAQQTTEAAKEDPTIPSTY